MNTHTKEEKPYCFDSLKGTLIEQGIELIHERGIEKLSLRKMAKQIGVSTAVCYNHFGNIDELLRGTYSYTIDRFATALRQVVEDNPCHNVAISMDVVYVGSFAEYPHYFNFLFDSEYLGVQIKEIEITQDSSFTPFEIFVNGARRGMRELNIDERGLRDDLLVMWVAVHDLAAMTNMKDVQYNNGNWGVLTGRALLNKVIPQHELKTRRNLLQRSQKQPGQGTQPGIIQRSRSHLRLLMDWRERLISVTSWGSCISSQQRKIGRHLKA